MSAFAVSPEPAFVVVAEEPMHAPAIRALYDAAFGPGRFTRAAHFIREMAGVDATLGRVGLIGDELVSSIRFSPVRIGATPALILGPLVVSPDYRNKGYGRALMARATQDAFAAGHEHIVLVGDEPYYRALGFRALPAGAVHFPAPVDPTRVLGASRTGEGVLQLAGEVRPA